MRRILVLSSVLSISLALMGGAVASAEVPPCTGSYSQSTLYSDQGRLESVIVGNSGRLYFSGALPGASLENEVSRLYKVDRPGATPSPILDGPAGPGGLAWSSKRLLWGYGNTLANGAAGDLTPKSGLFSVNPANGKRSIVSKTLGMANGIAHAKNGTIFASNDLGFKLDRIVKKGSAFNTTNGFANLYSANGLTISRNGKYLYAAQTFVTPSTISRIEIADPASIITYYTSPEAANLIFDGLTRDNLGNLYVAVLSRGEVWKINGSKQACVLATGLANPSNVAISNAKKGFKAGNLYAVEFGGKVTQVKGATKAEVPAS